MLDFKVGDIVIGQNFEKLEELNGKKGIIKHIFPFYNSKLFTEFSVEWECKFHEGHSCNGKTKNEQGRFFYTDSDNNDDSITINLKKYTVQLELDF